MYISHNVFRILQTPGKGKYIRSRKLKITEQNTYIMDKKERIKETQIYTFFLNAMKD